MFVYDDIHAINAGYMTYLILPLTNQSTTDKDC